MPCVLNSRVFGPLHLDGGERASPVNDEVHLRAVFGAEMIQFALAEVLETLPQFNSDPLLEKPAHIHLHYVGRCRQPRRCMAHT